MGDALSVPFIVLWADPRVYERFRYFTLPVYPYETVKRVG